MLGVVALLLLLGATVFVLNGGLPLGFGATPTARPERAAHFYRADPAAAHTGAADRDRRTADRYAGAAQRHARADEYRRVVAWRPMSPAGAARCAGGGGQLGLKINVTDQRNDPNHPEGTIITQDPAPGTQMNPGGTINVVVSKGPPVVSMPNVINTNGTDAEQYLTGLGFKVTVQQEQSGSVPAGVVSRQQPDPGTQIKVGDPVTIWVSTGDLVSVPDVIGQPAKQALAAMGNAGLKTKVVTVRPDRSRPAQSG